MKKFERTEEMEHKMVLDSFGGDVRMDVKVQIIYKGSKLKAYAVDLNSYLQFPRNLREPYAQYICDATESQSNGKIFYRAYKGTIRDLDGNVVG